VNSSSIDERDILEAHRDDIVVIVIVIPLLATPSHPRLLTTRGENRTFKKGGKIQSSHNKYVSLYKVKI